MRFFNSDLMDRLKREVHGAYVGGEVYDGGDVIRCGGEIYRALVTSYSDDGDVILCGGEV